MPDLSQRLQSALADRYRIERTLGRGGMATVFLAEDLKHHRRVAIKVLDPEVAAAIGPERFLREIETVAGLTHPHILPLHDSGTADALLFYVMPYVGGESLRERLTREKQLPLEDALQIAREVANALSYAHSRGVLHRDIKPENILLEEGHAVVADFGIARAVAAAGGEKLTATGIAVGTPAYMSPEQAAGSRDLDGRSDLYSLGCVLYEMLAGQPPFTGPTVTSLVHQHLNVLPHQVTEMRPSVPRAVDCALTKALAKTPADRYATAVQFRAALEVASITREADATGGNTRAGSRWPRPAMLGLALAAVVLAGVWLIPRIPSRGPRVHPRLVVLPFVNRGGGEDESFVGGMTDVVTAELAGLSGLEVISSRAARLYERSSKAVRKIAAELDVAYVLEATVQRERPGDPSSRVRVIPQLTRVRDNATVWVATLERDSTNNFRVQAQIAERVAEALDLALRQTDREALRRTYTRSSHAWDAYLRGLQQARVLSSSGLAEGLRLLDQAIQYDPDFALAYAARSWVHSQICWWGFDPGRSVEHQTAALRDAEHAERLNPAFPEVQTALGTYHYVFGPDYARAAQHLIEARKGRPSDGTVVMLLGNVYKRAGAWDEAVAALDRAASLDPSWAWIPWNIAQIHVWRREYDAAERALDRAVAIDPRMTAAFGLRAWICLMRDGDVAAARNVLGRAAKQAADYRLMRLPFLIETFDRQYQAALRTISTAPKSSSNSWDAGGLNDHLLVGMAYQALGHPLAARINLDSARVLIESRLGSPSTNLDRRQVAELRSQLTLALASLGRSNEAAREAAATLELDPVGVDAINGPLYVENVAVAYVRIGERNHALDLIEKLLSVPARFSPHVLRLDPRWDPIREHPRFKALLVKYANPERPAR